MGRTGPGCIAVRGPMQTEMSRQAAVIDVILQETEREQWQSCYPEWSKRASWKMERDPGEEVGVGATLTPGGRVRQAEGLAPAQAWEWDGAWHLGGEQGHPCG